MINYTFSFSKVIQMDNFASRIFKRPSAKYQSCSVLQIFVYVFHNRPRRRCKLSYRKSVVLRGSFVITFTLVAKPCYVHSRASILSCLTALFNLSEDHLLHTQEFCLFCIINIVNVRLVNRRMIKYMF